MHQVYICHAFWPMVQAMVKWKQHFWIIKANWIVKLKLLRRWLVSFISFGCWTDADCCYSSSSMPCPCSQWNVPGMQLHKRWAEEPQQQHSTESKVSHQHFRQVLSTSPRRVAVSYYWLLNQQQITVLFPCWVSSIDVCGSQALKNSYLFLMRLRSPAVLIHDNFRPC